MATGARPVVKKTIPHVWFPAGLLSAWRDLTKTEIVIDAVAREMCDRRERKISAAKFAERAGIDPSDTRKALRKLVELGLQKRTGNMRDPGGYVVTPASSEEMSARFSEAMPLDFAVPAAIVRGWHQWSRLEIRVFGAVCIHKEARRRGLGIADRVTSELLAGFLKEPDRSCRQALRELARRGVIRSEEGHRWAPTPWDDLAYAGDRAKPLGSEGEPAAPPFASGRSGNQHPELVAITPPSSGQRRPQVQGSAAPDLRGKTAVWPPSSSVVRTLSTRGRDLPPRDPPPSVHPMAGREGDEHLDERHDPTALEPLARAAVKAFADRNAVVDVNHAVRRLAEAKARYGMTNAELSQYVRTAPDQPGLLRAGFPFGAAFSPSRVEPWLERHRRRRVALAPGSPSDGRTLPVQELAIRGSAFLDSLGSGTRRTG
jgi:ribosomal protein S25